MAPARELTGVEVPGGLPAVETFSPGAEPVLAIRGISSQRLLDQLDHAASIMSQAGASATVGLIREALP